MANSETPCEQHSGRCMENFHSKIPLSTKIGDAVGSVEITDMWHDHFSELLNDVCKIESNSLVCEHIDVISYESKVLIVATA